MRQQLQVFYRERGAALGGGNLKLRGQDVDKRGRKALFLQRGRKILMELESKFSGILPHLILKANENFEKDKLGIA